MESQTPLDVSERTTVPLRSTVDQSDGSDPGHLDSVTRMNVCLGCKVKTECSLCLNSTFVYVGFSVSVSSQLCVFILCSGLGLIKKPLTVISEGKPGLRSWTCKTMKMQTFPDKERQFKVFDSWLSLCPSSSSPPPPPLLLSPLHLTCFKKHENLGLFCTAAYLKMAPQENRCHLLLLLLALIYLLCHLHHCHYKDQQDQPPTTAEG